MSNSQKYINVISILNIIGGAFGLIAGILAAVGGGIAGDALAQTEGAPTAATVIGFAIALMIAGGLSLLTGILGVRAAKDASKIGPVFVLAALSFGVTVIGIIASLVGGSFSLSSLTELVPTGLMLWCANNVKKQNQ